LARAAARPAQGAEARVQAQASRSEPSLQEPMPQREAASVRIQEAVAAAWPVLPTARLRFSART
jgi:hypothetical protein